MATALLVIDVQKGMFSMPGNAPHQGDETVARIAGLLAKARAQNVPVVFIQHDSTPEATLARGTPSFDYHEKLAPQPGEPVIVKRRPSAFHGTDLQERLKSLDVDRLVVAGMQTEFCVDSTVRSASEHGYRLTLAADAHTTFNTPVLTAPQIIAHHNFTLQDFAEIKPAAEIAF